MNESEESELELDTLLFILVDELTDDTGNLPKPAKRCKIHPMFASRESEGAYQVLITRHLKDNDSKFVEYFRLTPGLFHYILEKIKLDLEMVPYNRNKKPITSAEKLCITLR